MNKLYGEAALQHARETGAQLYYQDRPVSVAEAAQELVVQDPGAVSCELAAPPEGAAIEHIRLRLRR